MVFPRSYIFSFFPHFSFLLTVCTIFIIFLKLQHSFPLPCLVTPLVSKSSKLSLKNIHFLQSCISCESCIHVNHKFCSDLCDSVRDWRFRKAESHCDLLLCTFCLKAEEDEAVVLGGVSGRSPHNHRQRAMVVAPEWRFKPLYNWLHFISLDLFFSESFPPPRLS